MPPILDTGNLFPNESLASNAYDEWIERKPNERVSMLIRVRDTNLFVDFDGLGLAVEGNRMVERPVLFLLHGGPGGDHSSFKTQATAELRDVAQLVYVDHRGSGRSEPADPSAYTLDDNIEDLEALRKTLGLERISILGSSYGGMVAIGYAIRYPDRVANLVLAATAASHHFMDDAKRILAERGDTEQQRICQLLWDGNFESQEQLRDYYQLMGPMYSTTFDEAAFEPVWERGIRNFEQTNIGFSGFLKTFDYIDQLATIPCPTLVLAGAHDWICAPKHSQVIADLIPRAHLKVFANSAHSIAQDEPAEFLAAVRGFLTYSIGSSEPLVGGIVI